LYDLKKDLFDYPDLISLTLDSVAKIASIFLNGILYFLLHILV